MARLAVRSYSRGLLVQVAELLTAGLFGQGRGPRVGNFWRAAVLASTLCNKALMPAAARRGSSVAADLRVELGGSREGCGRRHQTWLQGLQQSAPRSGGGGTRKGQQVSCKRRHPKTKGMLNASSAVLCYMVLCRWVAGKAQFARLSTSIHLLSSSLLSTWLHGGFNPARVCRRVNCAAMHHSVGLQRLDWHLHAPAARDIIQCCTAQVAAMHGSR